MLLALCGMEDALVKAGRAVGGLWLQAGRLHSQRSELQPDVDTSSASQTGPRYGAAAGRPHAASKTWQTASAWALEGPGSQGPVWQHDTESSRVFRPPESPPESPLSASKAI